MGNVTLKHVPNLSGGRLFGLAADSGFDSIKVNGNRVSAGYELGDFSLLLV